MVIKPKTIFFAIHGIFAKRQIEPGNVLSMQTLVQAWPETMLRETDLARGLEALRKGGFVALETSMFGPEVRLLNDRFAQVVTEDDQRALAALALLRKVRVRPSRAAGATVKAPTGRRPGDPQSTTK